MGDNPYGEAGWPKEIIQSKNSSTRFSGILIICTENWDKVISCPIFGYFLLFYVIILVDWPNELDILVVY